MNNTLKRELKGVKTPVELFKTLDRINQNVHTNHKIKADKILNQVKAPKFNELDLIKDRVSTKILGLLEDETFASRNLSSSEKASDCKFSFAMQYQLPCRHMIAYHGTFRPNQVHSFWMLDNSSDLKSVVEGTVLFTRLQSGVSRLQENHDSESDSDKGKAFVKRFEDRLNSLNRESQNHLLSFFDGILSSVRSEDGDICVDVKRIKRDLSNQSIVDPQPAKKRGRPPKSRHSLNAKGKIL